MPLGHHERNNLCPVSIQYLAVNQANMYARNVRGVAELSYMIRPFFAIKSRYVKQVLYE